MTCHYPDMGSASDWQRFCLSDWLKQISHAGRPKILSLSVHAFSTKVLIGDTIFTSPTGDETAILRGHPSHAKV